MARPVAQPHRSVVVVKQQSRLLQLPLELRELIYRYALLAPKFPFLREVQGYRVAPELSDVATWRRPELSLLGTCQQIRQEASPIFYKETVFWEGSTDSMEQTITHAMVQGQHVNIRHISFIPFSNYLSFERRPMTGMRGAITSNMLYSSALRDQFWANLVDLPQLQTLEVPYQCLPFANSTSVGPLVDIMDTLHGNKGHLSVVNAWVNTRMEPWSHYTSFCYEYMLLTTAIKFETWDELVKCDTWSIFTAIYHAARRANEESPVPRKNITVAVNEIRYVVRFWGLPDKVKEESENKGKAPEEQGFAEETNSTDVD